MIERIKNFLHIFLRNFDIVEIILALVLVSVLLMGAIAVFVIFTKPEIENSPIEELYFEDGWVIRDVLYDSNWREFKYFCTDVETQTRLARCYPINKE